MRYIKALQMMVFTSFLLSCGKDHPGDPNKPPVPEPVAKKILLKDIVIPTVPSPFYHFEYNIDSTVSKVSFTDGAEVYDVIYSGNKIAEMRNNTFSNHDTLRYMYDNAGKLFMIKFINQENVIYRHVSFIYDGNLVKEIDWDHKENTAGFLIDRTITFTYHPDGNVETIAEHHPALNGSREINVFRQFENYDNNINVDDYDLIHSVDDHLVLFQGFRLQKNNPGKETYANGDIPFGYTIDYTYTYNRDNTPGLRNGNITITAGTDAGLKSQINSTFTYY